MKKVIYSVIIGLFFIFGCKTVRDEATSGLNEITISDPTNFEQAIKDKTKDKDGKTIYEDLKVVGYAVQIYAFKDMDKKPDKDNAIFCAYPSKPTDIKEFDVTNYILTKRGLEKQVKVEDKLLIKANGAKTYEDVLCTVAGDINNVEKGKSSAPFTFKEPAKDKDIGNFAMIQYFDPQNVDRSFTAMTNALKTEVKEAIEKEDKVLVRGNQMYLAGQEGKLEYFTYQKDKNLLKISLPKNYKKYCASVQYFCTHKGATDPALCLASATNKPKLACNEAGSDGKVSLPVTLLWTADYSKGSTYELTTSTEDVNVIIEPTIEK